MLKNLCPSLKNAVRTRTFVAFALILMVAVSVWHFAMQPSPSLSHRFIVGQRLVFRLEYLSASGSNFAGLTQEAEEVKDMQAIYTNVEADMHATVVEADAEGAWIACGFKSPGVQVVVNGELAVSQAEAIQADLSRGLLAFVDRQGRIRSVHFDSRINSLAHNFARALLATTQVVLPENASRTTWDTQEQDPNGAYGVRYQREDRSAAEPNIAVFSKVRTHYEPVRRAHSIRILEVQSTATPSGQLTVRFDEAKGHVLLVEGREGTTIAVNNKTVARVETTLKMSFLRAETLTATEHKSLLAACADLKNEPSLALSTPASTTAQEASIYRNELGDATLESLLGELASFDSRADANESDTQLYFKIKALIYLHPEACPDLAKVLCASKTDSRATRLLIDAMSSIGNAQAQSALQSAIRVRAGDASALAILVPALAMVETPAPSAELTLLEVAGSSKHASIRAAAELGLGTMAHQLAGVAPARSRRIAQAMADKLRTASSNEERRHLLFVLGNAGTHETLDVIMPFLKDSTPEVRAAAVAALRWIKAANIDELLCNALANDAEAAVRVEAVTALGFRTMTSATFVVHRDAFAKDASSSVRVALLQNLARSQSAFPEGRALLTQAASDPMQAVREEAESLLAIE
jgi:hypothetical protein